MFICQAPLHFFLLSLRVRVLFIGDIFAKPGLEVTRNYLRKHRDNYDFVIANGENTAGGFGIARKHFNQLLDWGVDVVTLGNHSWDQQEVMTLLEETSHLIRPLNYPPGTPGLGYVTLESRTGEHLTVVQLMGRIFMEPLDCPFQAVDTLLDTLPQGRPIIVEFHAEASSEKKVMGFHLSGRVAAVLGTHTHVQTADEILTRGTAYLTDVGMTGVQHSSIGMRFDEVHQRMVKKLPARFRPADGAATLCGVVLELEAGRAKRIERIQYLEGQDFDANTTR